MSKNLHNLKWDTVAVGDFPASITDNLQGFVGLEECTSYGFERDSKRPKKKKLQKKQQNTTEIEVPNKKVKLSNGFVVESCNSVAPSLTNEDITKINNDSNKTGNVKRTNKKLGKLNAKENQEVVEPVHNTTKAKLGADRSETRYNLTPEDMLTWAEFKLPEPILKALTELGFKQPTKIQQLSLPAAIHGRRDILGAAETGSGKTLAFGLPILIGIMKLKEKAAAGLDVYEIPYKKSSAKKKQKTNELDKNAANKKQKINKKRNQKKEVKAKESSEDGYSSGEESNNDETANENEEKSEEEYLEEFEVPVRKREPSADEGNDSDSDNYVHMSDMLDSDDLKDNSDDEENNDEQVSDEEANDELEEEPIIDGEGIGCVKVMDNIEIPGHTVVKTGKPLYALVLTPTRELAIQVSNHLTAAAKYTGIRVATLVGGLASVKQERVLRYGPEIVVATPGRLWELVTQGQTHLQQLDCVKFLAIDETDRMIEKNHFDELYPLLERLNADEAKRCSRQNFVFSATLTMVHELPRHMRGKKVTKRGKIINRKVEKMTAQQKVKRLVDMLGMTDPKVVDITQQNLGTAETLTESRITCSHEHKDSYLYYILKRHPGRTIVFCNSIGCVKRLTQLFSILRCQPLPLHASMEQRQRLKNLERFRDDAHGVLVATDVAARGLDIPDVDHVVHYQVPRTAENYVHRSGRTARANKEGLTILMMEPAEAFLYSKMCRTLNRTSEVPLFPVAPQSMAPIRELLNVARTIEGLELKKRKTAQAIGWREKVAKEMDIIVDEDDIPSKQVDPSIDKALKAKRRDLNVLLSRPLIPRGFSFKYPTLNDPDALKCVEENALQVMKNAIQSGELKKEKRKSKNSSLLKLEKTFKKK